MRFMDVLRDCIGMFVFGYFDDIFVYSKSLNEHLGHLRFVLAILREHKRFCEHRKMHLFV